MVNNFNMLKTAIKNHIEIIISNLLFLENLNI